MGKQKTTSRAYTLKLRGTGDRTDLSWKDDLWRTHVFVNLGAAFWGDVLLSFRGGISYKEAEGQDPKWKRRICALSWLTVEFPTPEGLPLPSPEATNTVDVLREILAEQGAASQEIEGWVEDCTPALKSEIREGARRVNRYRAFRMLAEQLGGISEQDRKDLLGRFLKGDYFEAEKAADAGSPDLVQAAANWLSNRFGNGTKSDDENLARIYGRLTEFSLKCREAGICEPQQARTMLAQDHQLGPFINFAGGTTQIGGAKGRPNATLLQLRKLDRDERPNEAYWAQLATAAEKDAIAAGSKIGQKVKREYSNQLMKVFETTTGVPYRLAGRDLTAEFAVVLDHAARKVVALHTWVKRQEKERLEAEGKLAETNAGDRAHALLQEFTLRRQFTAEPTKAYRIRRRAVSGWQEVVTAWRARRANSPEERIEIIRELQEDIEKFGDGQLFEALAQEEYREVWKDGPEALVRFAARQKLESLVERRKVPAYRAPDPIFHPIYCDYGNSRWGVEYAARKSKSAHRGITLLVFDGNKITKADLAWSSKRAATELLAGTPETLGVRSNRAGRAQAGGRPVRPAGLFEGGEWNARLQANRKALEQLASQRGGASIREWPAEKARGLEWWVTFSAKLTPEVQQVSLSSEDRNGKPLVRRLFSKHPAGLRLLSVDLGLRVGASCAVWETVADQALRQAAQAAGVDAPAAEALSYKMDGGGRFYRRISENLWARLDRQFVIRLDGEGNEARPLSQEERTRIRGAFPEVDATILNGSYPDAVAGLIAAARRELDYSAVLAKLTYALRQRQDDGKAIESLLARWQGRATRLGTGSKPALLWRECFPGGPGISESSADGNSENALGYLSQQLQEGGATAATVAQRLEYAWAAKEAEWPAKLKLLRRLVAPKQDELKCNQAAGRRTGGLSVDRIANVDAVRKLMRAFQNRPEPDNPRKNIPQQGGEPPFACRLQQMHERLREQRVKQLASRILEAAVGLGSEPGRGRKRAELIPTDARFARCPVVVIEDLSGYVMEQTRTRRENRQLAEWAKSKVKGHLTHGCELHGIFLWEVMPSYTSQYDFRTGAAGMRCRRVTANEWQRPHWRKAMAKARNDRSQYGEYMRKLEERFGGQGAQTYLVPSKGGNVFVPCSQTSDASTKTTVRSLDADLNAAANIGLWALLDPEWAPRWHRIRVEPDTWLLHPDSPAPGIDPARPVGRAAPASRKKARGKAPYQNLFLTGPAHDLQTADWKPYGEWQERVLEAVCTHLLMALSFDPEVPF